MCGEGPALVPRRAFGLGEWRVEPTLDRVLRGNEVVRVPPRVMQVLLCLADRAGEVVEKRHLLATVWEDEVVTEGALTRCVSLLRRILGDDASEPRYVENVPRRGYRLVMPPEPLAGLPVVPRRRRSSCWLCYGERRFNLSEGDNVIGRASDAAVHIDSRSVSRHHARIEVEGSRATLEDLGSKNGTFLDERRLESSSELQDGEQIRVGEVTLRFRVHDPEGSTETAHVH